MGMKDRYRDVLLPLPLFPLRSGGRTLYLLLRFIERPPPWLGMAAERSGIAREKGSLMRILIADDHAVVRQGLAALLERQTGLEVVGEADDGETAVALAKDLAPDLVLMDISMPRLNGMEAIRRICEQDPVVKIIVLSVHSEYTIVTEALKAGCHGYVLKSSLFKEVSAALEAVARGERYLSPEIARLMVDDYLQPGKADGKTGLKALTDRERQILQLIAEGLSVKEIGRRLQISRKTVDATRRNIFRKLQLHNVAQLTKFAVREGLTSAE
jgi:two-component system, NarL family, response regulator LiaR